MQERAIRTGAAEPDYETKWGRYLPLLRFNVDQSPLPYARDVTTTYEEIKKGSSENRNKKVWTSQPNTGDSKRFCTLNVCFRPFGQQPRIAIIFRGKGKRLSAVEKASWDKDVDVYFQRNAWADTDFCLQWSKKTLVPAVKDTGRFLIFLDNLEAHLKESFRNSIQDLGGIPWFGVPGATDIWQPVDGGYAATLKRLINQEFFDWLDDDENIEKWYGADMILITQWSGNAYRN